MAYLLPANRRKINMSKRRITAAATLCCLALAPWANSAAADSQDKLDEYLASPYVSTNDQGEITLDLLAGGEDAYLDTVEAMPVLDDQTITVVVPELPTLAERIEADAQLEAHEPHNRNENAACPTLFSSPRSARGARPDFGCDSGTGAEKSGPVIPGPLRQSVQSALQAALQYNLVDGQVPSLVVTEKAGRVVVNVTGDWATYVGAQEKHLAELQELLIRTVYSDQRAKSLRLELQGSCFNFSTSLGGDVCSEVGF
ncbi:hypothetical protein [Nocardioides sp. InS609-2]|uniref:hypothetical protein n=1 Tax=Nocardioides sp. InS609-2 TaxID=2760705 RepID=UPI0020BFFD3B|nr:hypothetical protein [Nocardioides sp. InS609-2]